MKLYAWMSDPHEGQPKQYPIGALVAGEHGTVIFALVSSVRTTLENEKMRFIAEKHASVHGVTVRFVSATIDDTLDIIEPGGDRHA